jgi:hypothetical protein
MIQLELKTIEKEMRSLGCKIEVVDFYHHQMEEFDILKMEHAFIDAKLLIY